MQCKPNPKRKAVFSVPRVMPRSVKNVLWRLDLANITAFSAHGLSLSLKLAPLEKTGGKSGEGRKKRRNGAHFSIV